MVLATRWENVDLSCGKNTLTPTDVGFITGSCCPVKRNRHLVFVPSRHSYRQEHRMEHPVCSDKHGHISVRSVRLDDPDVHPQIEILLIEKITTGVDPYGGTPVRNDRNTTIFHEFIIRPPVFTDCGKTFSRRRITGILTRPIEKSSRIPINCDFAFHREWTG